MVRLFFALWPDDVVCDLLSRSALELQQECGGRVTRTANLHLTLIFLGEILAERADRLRLAASLVSAPAFELRLDVLEYWPRNRIAWTGPAQCPGALRALVTQLEQALLAEGFKFDARGFVPHITLLRNASRAPEVLRTPDFVWPVREFVLVNSLRHESGMRYEILERWPLGAAL